MAKKTPAPTDADTIFGLQNALAIANEAKDGAYRERNQVVAALVRCYQALNYEVWLGRHPAEDASWEPDWRWIVFALLPTGQVSWHIHDSELPLFADLPREPYQAYDGHTTEQKYKRVLGWKPFLRRT